MNLYRGAFDILEEVIESQEAATIRRPNREPIEVPMHFADALDMANQPIERPYIVIKPAAGTTDRDSGSVLRTIGLKIQAVGNGPDDTGELMFSLMDSLEEVSGNLTGHDMNLAENGGKIVGLEVEEQFNMTKTDDVGTWIGEFDIRVTIEQPRRK